jgi:hypothetical protein
MVKGYPKSRFEILNQTSIQSIETTSVSNPTAIYMQLYTSNKGTEDWELISTFDGFTKSKGGMSFHKHGQAQLTVAQALRSGAYVLGKRLVSEDATLANTTVMARLVKVDDITYVYYYTKSALNCGSFDDACKAGYGTFDPEAESVTDIPLFTVTPMGRGESLIFFRINPITVSSKKKGTNEYIKYSFEVIEDNQVLENVVITMNPDIIIDGVSQAMNPKVRNTSNQVRVKLHEDGVYKLVKMLSKTAVDADGNSILPTNLINMDFINGYDYNGTTALGGIVTIAQNGNSENSEWVANKPSDIEVVYNLSDPVGIPLSYGSYGTMGNAPVNNATEMEKMLLAALGRDQDSSLFDSVIYDLDAYKIDAIFDCNWPISVKNAIIDLIDFRGDMVFLADLGTKANTLTLIKESVNGITNSNYAALYHNYFKILDPFTKKEITVTMPYLLIDKLTTHISKGVGRPFAGIANNIFFNNIIEGTVNFFQVEIPGSDQKQELIDRNINFLNMYDGIPVMETMYVNDNNYTQLSYLHNIMGVQEIIKLIRTRCPRTRYTFLDGDDLETYIADVQTVIKEYATNFRSIDCEYMADEAYEQNNIFYAVLKVQFKNFIQEEYFKIIAIS